MSSTHYTPLPTTPSLPAAEFDAPIGRRGFRYTFRSRLILFLTATLFVGLVLIGSTSEFGSQVVGHSKELGAKVVSGSKDLASNTWREWTDAIGWSEEWDDDREIDDSSRGETLLDEVAGSDLADSTTSQEVNPAETQEASTTPSSPSRLDSCSKRLTKSLAQAGSWRMERISSHRFRVKPKSIPRNTSPWCYGHAVFSSRLVSTTGDIVYALPTPIFVDSGLPAFEIVVPATAQLPDGEYVLEVVLEFGYLPGAVDGQVCGADQRFCHVAEMDTEQSFVGVAIEWERKEDSIVTVDFDGDSSLAKPSTCSAKLSPLRGYWQKDVFHPNLASGPCSLVEPHFPIPLPPSTEPLWISLIGDSNTRNLEKHFVNSLGGGPTAQWFTMESAVKNGTVTSIAFRYRSGQHERSRVPEVIVTWQWWMEGAFPPFDSSLSELSHLLTMPLSSLLTQSPDLVRPLRDFPSLHQISTTLHPYRTYVSLGSHAESLTTIGHTEFLSQLPELPAHTRFFTTTLVYAGNIPLTRFAKQDLVRNNAVIHARNEAVRTFPKLQGKVLDVEGLTQGLDAEWMKIGGKPGHPKLDAVHFVDRIYNAWVRLVWTDMSA